MQGGSITFNENQLKALQLVDDAFNSEGRHIVGIFGEGGCVDMDTEYLTPNGWKKISEYEDNDMVCQWSPDGTTEFVIPSHYTKLPAEHLTRVQTATVDMVLSNSHRTPYITSRGKHAVKPFSEIMEMSKVDIPRGFKTPSNAAGVDLTDDELRILIMQAADGSICKKAKRFKVWVNVKKDRKKTRLIQLLEDAGIEYKTVWSAPGYLKLFYYPPKQLQHKGLDKLWTCNEHQVQIAYHELIFWDGSVSKRTNIMAPRITGNKTDMEVAQYILSCASGNYTSIYMDNREYVNGPIFNVAVSSRDSSYIELKEPTTENSNRRQADISTYRTLDGYQYCFTVGSSFWLARRNGKIFPTGNTGKSVVIEEIAKRYPDVTVKTAMTSVAAGNIGGKTIHSHLNMIQRYNEEATTYNSWTEFMPTSNVGSENNICIVDEISMAGEKMLNTIAENQNYKVLVLVGDSYQLPPVNDNRVELEKSHRVKSVILTEQMRNEDGVYKLISDFRSTRGTGDNIDVFDYVDGVNIRSISMDELKDTFINDKNESKLIVAFKNEDVDAIIDDTIQIRTGKLRLSGSISQVSGRTSNNKTRMSIDKIAHNGEIVEVDKVFISWNAAMSNYKQTPYYDKRTTIYTKWNIHEFNIDERKIVKCSLKNKNAPFVKLFTGSYKEMETIEKKYFEEWKEAKNLYGISDMRTRVLMNRHKEFKNNIVHVREPYCTTVHKSQGQTVDSIYIYIDKHIIENKSLMYVALSRAKKRITFITEPTQL